MADNNVDIKVSDNVASTIAPKIRAIGDAARLSFSAVEELKASLRGFSAVSAITQAASGMSNLRAQVASTNSTVSALRVQVTQLNTALGATQRNANSASAAVNQVGRSAAGASPLLRQLLGFLSVGFAVQEYVRLSDAYTTINNKLRTITTTQAELTTLQDRLFASANNSRVGVEGMTDAYVRFAKVLGPIGLNQEQIIRFTETLTKALKSSGKTSAEAASGVIQLGQALQSGKLAGDEFRSVMENMPIELLNALAKTLGTNVEHIKDLAKQGKITRDVILKAVTSIGPAVDAMFAKTTGTITDSLTRLSNNTIKYLGDAQGSASLLSGAIGLIADNLNIVIPLVAILGAAWAAVQLRALYLDVKFLVVGMYEWATATKTLAAANAFLSGTLIPLIIAVADFTLGFIAGVAAIYAVAAGIAFLTGRMDEFNTWIVDTTTSIIKFAQDVGKGAVDASQKVTGLGAQGRAAGSSIASSMDGAKASVDALGKAVDATSAKMGAMAHKYNAYTTVVDNNVNTMRWKMQHPNANWNSGKPLPIFDNMGGDSIQQFATGGSFRVGGNSGVDKNLVKFRASSDERVDVLTPAQQRAQANAMQGGGNDNSRTVHMNVYTADADSFKRSRRQITNELQMALGA